MHVRSSDTTARVQGGRLAWIDMARGFCVMAVVLLHVGLFHVLPLSPDSHGRPLARAWELFNNVILADLRMPLLLLLSGFLARTKVRNGLGYARTRLAVATNLYLYVVWTLVFFALGVLFYPTLGDGPFTARDPIGLGTSLLYPQNGPLWFVYVLAVSMALLAATRRLPRSLVLAGFFVLGWVSFLITNDIAGMPRGVFYAAGALIGEELIAMAASPLVAIVAALGYGGLTVLAEVLDPAAAYPVNVLAGLCAAVAFVAVARLVARVSVLREPGAWVGRRTLGIYVLHWPLVAALTWIGTRHPDALTGLLRHQLADVVYPVAVAAVVIVVCFALQRLLRLVGLGLLFEVPAPLADRITHSSTTGRT